MILIENVPHITNGIGSKDIINIVEKGIMLFFRHIYELVYKKTDPSAVMYKAIEIAKDETNNKDTFSTNYFTLDRSKLHKLYTDLITERNLTGLSLPVQRGRTVAEWREKVATGEGHKAAMEESKRIAEKRQGKATTPESKAEKSKIINMMWFDVRSMVIIGLASLGVVLVVVSFVAYCACKRKETSEAKKEEGSIMGVGERGGVIKARNCCCGSRGGATEV